MLAIDSAFLAAPFVYSAAPSILAFLTTIHLSLVVLRVHRRPAARRLQFGHTRFGSVCRARRAPRLYCPPTRSRSRLPGHISHAKRAHVPSRLVIAVWCTSLSL